MAHGPLSLLYGDIDPLTHFHKTADLIAFALAGPLRLKLPNGTDVTIAEDWLVYLPLGAFGSVFAATVADSRTVQRAFVSAEIGGQQWRDLTSADTEDERLNAVEEDDDGEYFMPTSGRSPVVLPDAVPF